MQEQMLKCVPCESLGDSSFLLLPNLKETQESLSKLKLWTHDMGENHVKMISRSFVAKNFQCALDAINDIGRVAEREGHHPDVHLTSY